jgi:hypothetical protein
MCKNCVKIIILIGLLSTLTNCVATPTLFSIGSYNITLGSIVTIPIKKKIVEELINERNNNEEDTREDSEETE